MVSSQDDRGQSTKVLVEFLWLLSDKMFNILLMLIQMTLTNGIKMVAKQRIFGVRAMLMKIVLAISITNTSWHICSLPHV